MLRSVIKPFCLSLIVMIFVADATYAQTSLKLKFKKSAVYAGIEVGSKGVKMSFIEIANKALNTGTYNLLKDTSVNTDFISFSQPTFDATLRELTSLYTYVSSFTRLFMIT